MIGILLAEDHQVVRQGLRALLEAEHDFTVLGEAEDGLQVMEKVEQLAPDVLVLDWMLPGLQGLEVTRKVTRLTSRTSVLVLSMHADVSYVVQALHAGANGYVLKDSSVSELVAGIRHCIQGRRYLSQDLPIQKIEDALERLHTNELDPYRSLTPREREVLQLVAEGRTSQQIAERLSISRRTVETHRSNLMRKLSLENQSEVTRFAIQRGIIDAG